MQQGMSAATAVQEKMAQQMQRATGAGAAQVAAGAAASGAATKAAGSAKPAVLKP